MDPTQTISDPFHRALYAVIVEKSQDRVAALAAGQMADYAQYRDSCGYLAALKDVLGWCEELERDRYGNPPARD